MQNYKIPKELKKRMERELRQYYYNKKKLNKLKNDIINEKNKTKDPTGTTVTKVESTRSLLYLEERIEYVENVYNKLRPFEQEVYDLIFKEGCDFTYCETNKNVSRTTYYNILNKSVYLLAEEWGEI